ncbi:uncharacterized protein I206_103066 [Kwoniella pini CBS 10737]|uniref:Velvet domain-containing protein n=1 Tax=Kwoniella pini CBS 10737 TaxID=1296096 RepID=A0A1B9IB67_9TREE|nr:uncharacterized protein I206_01930 [Kwoniella pini CBS 10737]OCF52637.1 hypothetical protein I206_01930 [Kwoniella pini CBS 10737]
MVSRPPHKNLESSRDQSSRSTLRPGVTHHTAAGSNEGSSYPHPIRRYIPVTELANNFLSDNRYADHNQGQNPEDARYDSTQFVRHTEIRGTRIIHPPPQPYPSHATSGQGDGRAFDIPITTCLPPPPAEHLPSFGTINLSGYQTDYSRVMSDESLRRAPRSDCIRAAAQIGDEEDNLPVPAEAYVIIRPHRSPNQGWNDGIAQEMQEATRWIYELHLVQQPIRGKALGLGPLPRGWPALSAPLIVQLVVRDQNGREISIDHPILNRKLVHTSMMVDLVSEDGKESRSFMRVRPKPGTPNKPTSPTSANHLNPDMFSQTHRNLLGSLHRSANTYILDGKKGIYFLFTELVVRNVGRFALRVSLLDLAGPNHIGTSIGITQTISAAITQPFTIYHATQFPGALPVTDLSMEFTRQGERNLGRRTRADNNGISSEDDQVNRESGSPEINVQISATTTSEIGPSDHTRDLGQDSPLGQEPPYSAGERIYILRGGRRLGDIPVDPQVNQGGQGRKPDFENHDNSDFQRSHL